MNKKAMYKVVKNIMAKYKDDDLGLYLLQNIIESLEMGDDVSEKLVEKMILEELNKELLKKD